MECDVLRCNVCTHVCVRVRVGVYVVCVCVDVRMCACVCLCVLYHLTSHSSHDITIDTRFDYITLHYITTHCIT